jgi:hypothetical protein
MKLSTGVWIRNSFRNHFHQRPVVEVGANVLLGAGGFHSAVEGNRNLHTRFPPASICIQPFSLSITICVAAAKLGIYSGPFGMTDMVWLKGRISDNVNEFLEALLGFLNPAVPVPIPQEK